MKKSNFIVFVLTLVSALLLCSCTQTQKITNEKQIAIQKPSWQLSWHDEFDKMDHSKWDFNDSFGKERWSELQAYDFPGAFEIRDGILMLKTEKQQAMYDGKMRDYTSGMMSTRKIFLQKFGWFEFRAKAPTGRGFWPALWLLDDPHVMEIDILEMLCHRPNVATFNIHWNDETGKHQARYKEYEGPDFSEDFHVYAIEWNKNVVVWYVDGIERHRSYEGVPQKEMYLIMNLAVGGPVPGNPNAQTKFPSSFDIDYVRVYKKTASEN